MGSYTNLNYHLVFGTKYRRKTISEDHQERLYEYIGGLIRSRKGHLIQVGGIQDHIHILASLSPVNSLSETLREIKASASGWVNETFKPKEKFQWQKGYGAFTVSFSQIPIVTRYIKSQADHHRRLTFQEEFAELLRRHGIEFEMKYLFEDEHHG